MRVFFVRSRSCSFLLTGCEHLIGQFPRTTGSNLARHPCWRTLKTKCIGVAKAVKTVVLCARLRAWSRGCDDSRGDTRLARGLPFGSMPCVLPPRPMPQGLVTEGGDRDGTYRTLSTYSPTNSVNGWRHHHSLGEAVTPAISPVGAAPELRNVAVAEPQLHRQTFLMSWCSDAVAEGVGDS